MSDDAQEPQETQPAEEQAPAKKMVFCAWCGKHAESAPATWSMITMPDRGAQLLCEACTRTNLRSIESQLSTDWW